MTLTRNGHTYCVIRHLRNGGAVVMDVFGRLMILEGV